MGEHDLHEGLHLGRRFTLGPQTHDERPELASGGLAPEDLLHGPGGLFTAQVPTLSQGAQDVGPGGHATVSLRQWRR